VAVVRKVEINHFHGIRTLDWCPGEGINCLIGPGDSARPPYSTPLTCASVPGAI